MPAIIDVKASLGAVLIGCFVAIAYAVHPHLLFVPLLTRVSVVQVLGSCGLSSMHLLPTVPI